MSEQEWRDIPGIEGYQAHPTGRIRSVDRTVERKGRGGGTHTWRYKGRELALPVAGNGYPMVRIRNKPWCVHTLIMKTFVGPRPEGSEVRHLDGDRCNNSVDNLKYGTHSENMMDRERHGTDHERAKTHCKRGHPLSEPNLRADRKRDGHRVCLSCNRASAYLRADDPGFKELADLEYAKLTGK